MQVYLFFLFIFAAGSHIVAADHGGWGRDKGRRGDNDGGPCQKLSLNVAPSGQIAANTGMNVTCSFSRSIPIVLYLALAQSHGAIAQTLAEVSPYQAAVLMLDALVTRVSVLIDYQQQSVTFVYVSTTPTDSGTYQCLGSLLEQSNQVDVVVTSPSPSPSRAVFSSSATRSTIKASVVSVSVSVSVSKSVSVSWFATNAPLLSNASAYNVSKLYACFAKAHEALQVAAIVVPPVCAVLVLVAALLLFRYVRRLRAAGSNGTGTGTGTGVAKEKGSKYVHFENELDYDNENQNPLDQPPSYSAVVVDAHAKADQPPPTYDATRGVV